MGQERITYIDPVSTCSTTIDRPFEKRSVGPREVMFGSMKELLNRNA